MQETQNTIVPVLLSVKTLSVSKDDQGDLTAEVLPVTTSVFIQKSPKTDGAYLSIEISCHVFSLTGHEQLSVQTVSVFFLPGIAESESMDLFYAGRDMVSQAIGHNRGVLSTHLNGAHGVTRLFTNVPPDVVGQIVLEQLMG